MLAPPPVMRYSPLAASYWALPPGGVCPTLPSFVKIPRLFVCGETSATATPSAITTESAHAGKKDIFLRIICTAPILESLAELSPPQAGEQRTAIRAPQWL